LEIEMAIATAETTWKTSENVVENMPEPGSGKFDYAAAMKLIAAAESTRKPKPKLQKPIPIITEQRNGPPVAFGYGRVSTDDQYNTGPSVCDQKVRAERYYEMFLKDTGVVWGGFRDDGKGTSASKVPFFERPAGSKIMQELRPGDHIVFDKIDRMWRRVIDFCNVSEWFSQHNITMHIVNMGGGMSFNTGSAQGRSFLVMMANFAEMESEMKADRIRDAMAEKKKRCSAPHQMLYGTTVIKRNGQDVAAWHIEQRKEMRIAVDLHDNHHFTFVEVSLELENMRREKEGKPRMNRIVRSRWLTHPRKMIWRDRYYIEKAIQILGITDPTQLPKLATIDTVVAKWNAEYMADWAVVRTAKLGNRKSMVDD
jgi:DNA invertase Pin-like site-specific DNA recombinase